ncbi:MAG: hypothetical protein ACTHWH_06250 [Marinobacter sp.]
MSMNEADMNRSTDTVDRRDRRFAVSTNRGKASHRLRYVEAGGASVDLDECTFCESIPDLSGAAQAQKGKKEE